MTKRLPTGFASPIVLLAVGLIVGISLTFAYFQFKSKPAPQPQPTTSQSSPVSKVFPNASTDETASWKTYKNSQYGFEVKYPPQWSVNDRKTEFTISDGNLKFEIIMSNAGRGTYFTESKKSSVDVNNVQGERTDFLTSNKQVFVSPISFPNYKKDGWDSGYIMLDATGSPGFEIDNVVNSQNQQATRGQVKNFETLDQILSTFKFEQSLK